MGKIIRKDKETIVEFDAGEVILSPAQVILPDKKMQITGVIGNFISRAAWKILKEKAPHLVMTKNYRRTEIRGNGKITVTFHEEEL